ncbi:MAG: hypothetical protein EBR47_09025 [Betaproteobacteria bacterium]|jgi:hypothetical protein|nr:hypothetical protein [Betaproteobacteria bacterium]
MSDLFPPVTYLNQREPWGVPQYIPPSPHNLPTRPEPGAAPNTTQTVASGGTVDVREVYRYASVVTVSINVSTASIKFLDAPIGKRNFLGFRNAGATTLYIDFNAQATTGAWLAVASGVLVLFDTVVPQDDLYVISSAAGGILAYAYSTFPG